MSTPTLRQADNGVYYIHWTEGRRTKRRTTGTKDMAKAKAVLGHFLLMEQQEPSTGEQSFTVAELWTVYHKKHGPKVASLKTLDCSWKNLQVYFGDMPLAAVTQDSVDAYVAKRRTGKIGRPSQENTVGRELRNLRGCFGWCADPKRKIITRAQIPNFSVPGDSEPRDRWLKTDEVQRLLRAAAEFRRGDQKRLSRAERFLWLALETGARKTALYELTWDRVDFETGVIHLNVPGRVQTKKRRADVPMSKALRPVLERAYAERLNDLVLDHGADLWASLQSIAVRAGLAQRQPRGSGHKPLKTGISPHVLRHTAATHMARRGVPLWKIAKILGNSLLQIEKTYAKHAPDDLREAVDMISGGVLETVE